LLTNDSILKPGMFVAMIGGICRTSNIAYFDGIYLVERRGQFDSNLLVREIVIIIDKLPSTIGCF
jgi:hypothetical protein